MVKIDDTYFEDDLEVELQEPTPVATDEPATDPQPRPLLGDLLDEEVSSEAIDTDTQSDFAPATMDPADEEATRDPATLESTPLAEPETPEVPETSEALFTSEELEEEDVEEEDEEDIGEEPSEESDQSTRKRSSRGLWFWLGGDALELPAFRKYIPVFITIFLMGLIHVTSNYLIIDKRRHIDKLETRVKDLTYKHMESVSELTRRSIGGNFEQQLQAMGSDLEAPSQQSIILYRDNKK
ncbi:FtsL-like putative cell division protein [uncultured Porphyromonas sp.]|uniref:FtsL-like putative cell division protein n=1 Tax=uncultured Porphyromonas sp. TaxID=159274 RepID=UPI00262F5B43|nr:FtsL-like putative cell division protein [uncultured Porphyromonas sp.]